MNPSKNEQDSIADIIAQFISEIDSKITTLQEDVTALHNRTTNLGQISHRTITEIRATLKGHTQRLDDFINYTRNELQHLRDIVEERHDPPEA